MRDSRRTINIPINRLTHSPSNPIHFLSNGLTLLSDYASKGDLTGFSDLMGIGANMNTYNIDGTQAIHVATINGHTSIVGYLIRKGMNVDNYDGNNCTSLHYAAEKGYIDIVKMLVRSGADVNCDAPKKMKPIHFAAIHGHIEVVRYLVDVNADFDVRNSQGHTPLLLAAVHGKRGVVDFLVVSGADVDNCVTDKWRVLHHAAQNGWIEIARHLVHRGAQLNYKTACGQTALLLATRNFHEGIVSLLVEAGADLECDSDKDRWSVLHHASYMGWVGIVRSLVNRTIDLNALTYRGETAILLAAKMGNTEVVDALIPAGVDLNCKDERNWSLLHFAAHRGWLEYVEYFLKRGLDINAKGSLNETPLFAACSNGQLSVANLLLKAGADSTATNINGTMPFNNLIADLECYGAIRAFVESGAYLNYETFCMYVPRSSLLKDGLRDVSLCTLSILNKFNNKDLPDLYKSPFAAFLPPMETLTIVNNEEVTEVIRKGVEKEISLKGMCNINEIKPMVLSMKCVKTLVEYSNAQPQRRPKRPARCACRRNLRRKSPRLNE